MLLCLAHGGKEGEGHGSFNPLNLATVVPGIMFLLEVLPSFTHSPRTLILHSHLTFI